MLRRAAARTQCSQLRSGGPGFVLLQVHLSTSWRRLSRLATAPERRPRSAGASGLRGVFFSQSQPSMTIGASYSEIWGEMGERWDTALCDNRRLFQREPALLAPLRLQTTGSLLLLRRRWGARAVASTAHSLALLSDAIGMVAAMRRAAHTHTVGEHRPLARQAESARRVVGGAVNREL